MNKKYELTDETKVIGNTTLHRIRALRDIPRHGVKSGDLGGWIEKEDNLPHEGDAWVLGDALVIGDARVSGNASVFGNARVSCNVRVYGDAEVSGNVRVFGDAEVFGNAEVYGNVWVCGNARVCGDAIVDKEADYMTFKNTWSSGRWFTYTRSNKMWKVGCFYGNGEELIKKAYADSELSGKCYAAIVRAVETIEAAQGETKGATNEQK